MEPEIRELAAQPPAVERATTGADGITAVIDAGFPRLFGRLAERGVAPTGAPFIRYLRTGDVFELELGVPVPEAAAEAELKRVTDIHIPVVERDGLTPP